MPQFRLTQKYAKDCHMTILAEPEPVDHPLDDWFVDVMRVDRKKIAMVTHAQSTFTFLIPYAEVKKATAVPEYMSRLLVKFLQEQNLSQWVEQAALLFSGSKRFCKTADRKILAHMNDFKRCVDGFTKYSPICEHPIRWEQVANMINEMPVNFSVANQYIFPKEMLKNLIAHVDPNILARNQKL